MARPREFDRDHVLGKAIEVFASHGYEGASTEVLLARMGISRQSMYDTFGDKRRLYLEALERYSGRSTAEIIAAMNAESSAAKGLEAALLQFAMRPSVRPEDGCLGVGALTEFGRTDRQVTAITYRHTDVRRRGSLANLDKRRTLMANIKRNATRGGMIPEPPMVVKPLCVPSGGLLTSHEKMTPCRPAAGRGGHRCEVCSRPPSR